MNLEFDMNDFREVVKTEEKMYLATSANNHVLLRIVSPLLVGDKIIFYTGNHSNKYQQMKDNKNVGVYIGNYQLEGTVNFLGHYDTLENKEIKKLYKEKYIGAFEYFVPGEDPTKIEFIEVNVKHLMGWVFEGENPIGMVEKEF